jgi:hypothetical protein
MLWKESYRTKIIRDLKCPESQIVTLAGVPYESSIQVWIAGFGFECLTEQSVWWRLFESDFAGDQRVRKMFILDLVNKQVMNEVQALVAPSEFSRISFIEDQRQVWTELIKPDTQHRGFAAIFENGQLPLVMIGPPTEDAWEEFSNFWRLRTL